MKTIHSISRGYLATAVIALLMVGGACMSEEDATADPEAIVIDDIGPAEAAETVTASDEAETKARHFCCKIKWIAQEDGPFICQGYKTYRVWAETKCAALSASVPGTYPDLDSGTCASNPEC